MSGEPMTYQFCSRPTIMDGEVVDFAPGFAKREGAFGPWWDAAGCFAVSASRNAVVVHRAECRSMIELQLLLCALRTAEDFRVALAAQNPFNRQRLYPRDPQAVDVRPPYSGSDAFNRAVGRGLGTDDGGAA